MDATQQLNLSIVLPLRNQAQLKTLLSRIYDPSSPDYHHFLSVAEFTQQFGPSAQDYQSVVDFAKTNGFEVTGHPPNRLVVPIRGTVDQVQTAFHTAMTVYQHPTENRAFFSPDREPSLALHVPIAHIAGLNNFSIPHSMTVKRGVDRSLIGIAVQGSGPGGSYLASDMRAAYYGSTALSGTGQTVALVQFDGYDINDVTATLDGSATATAVGNNYLLSYTPIANGQTYTIALNNVLLDGATGAAGQFQSPTQDAEQALDIAQVVGMAPGLSQVRVYIGESDADILNEVASEDIAQQVSISWSWSPDDPSISEVFFQEMAVQGQSVFVASGDSGAYDILSPYFYPAENGFVTAVGGTSLVTENAGGSWASESAWTQSGGGVSPDQMPIPFWQDGIANSSNQASSVYRNVPDVAMEADFDNYACNLGTCSGGWAGTSFAAPRWAGYTALINQQAGIQGYPPVGFLNPTIYALGESANYGTNLHDITSGTNAYFGLEQDFSAVPGYDLVTGWGSPNGASLTNAFSPNQSSGFWLSSSPNSLKMHPGGTATSVITVNGVGGLAGNVTFTASPLPAGITASFSPNPGDTSTTLKIAADATVPRGTNLIIITGSCDQQSASTTIMLQIDAPGFTVTPGVPLVVTHPGYAESTYVYLSDFGGFSGDINLSVTSPLPSGVTALLNPSQSTGTSLITFVADELAPDSMSVLSITGTAAGKTSNHTVYLEVEQPIFALNISPIELNITQGSSITMSLSLVPWGNFTGTAKFFAWELPSGVIAQFDPASLSPGETGRVTLTASSSAALGTSILALSADTDTTEAVFSYPITTTATPTPSFSIGASSMSVVLPQSGAVDDQLVVNQENGFTGSVTMEPASLPGVTASYSPNPTNQSSVLTLTAANDAYPSLWQFNPYALSGSQQAPISVFTLITPTVSFTLDTSTVPLVIPVGGAATTDIAIVPQNGFSGSANLSWSGLPDGMTASFSSNPTQGNAVLSVSADASVAVGNYYVNVSATDGVQTLIRTIFVNVAAGTVAATPTFSPTPGTYTSTQSVSISDTTPSEAIYYTTNGTTPTTSSSLYNGPITVSASETIEAVATASGYSPSAVALAPYTITPLAIAAPTVTSISPAYTDAGSTAFTLAVSGAGFTSTSVVYWGTSALSTQFLSASQLTAQVPASFIAISEVSPITVQGSNIPGSTSNTLQFEVDSASGSTSSPTFTSATATVNPGSIASYPVTTPSSATVVSATCLNLPSGSTCSYSSTAGVVTVNTKPFTPAGTYQVTVVFNETVPGTASAWVLFPFLLLPFAALRKRGPVGKLWPAVLLVSAFALAEFVFGCGGGANAPVSPAPVPTQQVTSSGTVSINVQ
jgi:hypothetical protein